MSAEGIVRDAVAAIAPDSCTNKSFWGHVGLNRLLIFAVNIKDHHMGIWQ
jgi:hypothetical protein